MENKNNYSVIAFFKNGAPKKWTYVHNLKKFSQFLNDKHTGWQYFNVYERRTGKYLKRFYPNNIIPRFLSIVLIGIILSGIPYLTFNNSRCSIANHPLLTFSPSTFNNGFNNTATIPNDFIKAGGVEW